MERLWDIPKYIQDDLFSPHTTTPPSRRMAYTHVEVVLYVTAAVFFSFLLKENAANHCGRITEIQLYNYMCVVLFWFFVLFCSASCSQMLSACCARAMQFTQEVFPSSGTAWKGSLWLSDFCSVGLFGEIVSNSRLLLLRLPELSQISTQKCMILCGAWVQNLKYLKISVN